MGALTGLTPEEARSFKFKSLIIHVVPHHPKGEEGTPDLSERPAQLTARMKTFFARRITSTFGTKPVPCVENPAATQKTPDRVRELIGHPRNLKKASDVLAQGLYDVQGGAQEESVLVVATGSVELDNASRPAVLLMKLAQTEGVELKKERGTYGASVLDLMLTDEQKVFKAAILVQNDDSTLFGIVSDGQVADGAVFWRETYLGMKPVKTADWLTRDWFMGVQSYIDESVQDAETHRKYSSALRVEIESNRSTIDPKKFAVDYFNDGDADALIDHLKEAGAPTVKFDKNDVRLKPREKVMTRRTESGVKVTAPAEIFEELVDVVQLDGQTVTVIREGLER